jgi:phosphatidylserine/phosphatidylglycerophosphate/cardiolipin synthase-like enzyme
MDRPRAGPGWPRLLRAPRRRVDNRAMDFIRPERAVALRLVSGRGHLETVIDAVLLAETSVWIATANLKELLVAGTGRRTRSILAVLDEHVRRGLELRILHAGVPSAPSAHQLRGRPRLGGALRACPRVHLKMVVVDGAFLYLGSANWTGAGLGARGSGRRNFELGVVTADEGMLDDAQGVFDHLWRGRECRGCRLRAECGAPIADSFGEE